MCSRPFVDDDWATIEHVVPRSKGGAHGGNILLACASCNNKKGDRDPTPAELATLALANAGWNETFAAAEATLGEAWAA